MAMTVSSGGSKRPISDINVTPLVDVMLVLLIIFIIVTPAMKENVDVDLPQGRGLPVEGGYDDPTNVVTIDKFRIVHVGPQPLAMADVDAEFPRLFKGREKQILTLRAHKALSYEDVVRVVSALRQAGIETIHIEVDPREETAK